MPSKVRNFLWRLSHPSLPTTDLLNHRNMLSVLVSGLCGSNDSWHQPVMNCNIALCVWAFEDPDLVEVIDGNRKPDARRWIFSLIESLPHDAFLKVCQPLGYMERTQEGYP